MIEQQAISVLIAHAIRNALEQAAVAIENRAGNKTYQDAWRIAARVIREHKPD